MTHLALAAVAATGDPADPACVDALAALGFREPVRACTNLRRLGGEVPPGGQGAAFYAALEGALAGLPAPDRALNSLERLVGTARDRPALAARLTADPQGLRRLLRVFAASEFLGEAFVAAPAVAEQLLLDEGWDAPLQTEDFARLWQATAANGSDLPAVHAALRRYKRRILAQLGVQDVLGVSTVDQELAGMTAYADCCLRVAYDAAYAAVASRYGPPGEASGAAATFTVLALGKCGGAELNYSSDIDLIFCYSAAGETRPPAGGTPITNAEFFTKVGEQFINLLASHEGGGRVFRIDMRLRPQGTKGALVCSRAALLEYYESWGRTWERQMLIKARPVAGDLELGAALLQELRPFIYPKYLDLKAIRDVHGLKRTIEQQADRAGDAGVDVKLGPGGIRDIEFAIQFLQLLNGGRRPALRTGNTLAAIAAAADAELLTGKDATELAAAYRFLRRVENRLQLWADRQVHRLPTATDAQEAFAVGLGYAATRGAGAWDAFDAAYQRHTGVVRKVFNVVLGDAYDEAPVQAPVVALLRVPQPEAEAAARVLAPYGLRDPAAAWAHIEHLAFGPPAAPLTSAARDAFRQLCPRMLQHLAATPDPDHALANVRTCLDVFGAPGAFYNLLLQHPRAIEVFVTLASFSETLIRILLRDPGMLDFLIRDSQLQHAAEPRHIKRALDQFLEINPDFQIALRRFRNGELLRIGLRDMLELAPSREVTAELSAVAATVIDHLWAHEAAELTKQYGSPLEADSHALAESVVLGLGKFGGQELNYTSDLDVVFVYSAPGETAGEVDAPITNQEYFLKLAQRVTRHATATSPYGVLYKIDARLRPYGGQGSLALSAEEFLTYYRTKAAPWEHQALLRLRPVAGNRVLGRQLIEAVHQLVFAPGFWRTDLVDRADTMLHKVQAHRTERAAGLALKNEVGGILEVEFLVQVLMLRYGAAHPAVREPNTLHALAALELVEALPSGDARALATAYEFLRHTENRLRIMYGREAAELPADPAARDRLAARLGLDSHSDLPAGQVLEETIRSSFHRVHAIYERTVTRLRAEAL